MNLLMEQIWGRIATEAGLIVLLETAAIVFLWRELVKAQNALIENLKETNNDKRNTADLFRGFQEVLKGNKEALEDNTDKLVGMERTIHDRNSKGA